MVVSDPVARAPIAPSYAAAPLVVEQADPDTFFTAAWTSPAAQDFLSKILTH